jgi:urate oxidase / 2-oxo-4-hydroxy-4-carboxy-5-ureidoimidazoline decarboxylase
MAQPLGIYYGKDAVSVYRLDGAGGLFAAEVRIVLFGESFLPSYTEGDNALVVATDSMKNFVHRTALDHEGSSLEDFLELVGTRFLATYPHVERVALRAREVPFARRGDAVLQRVYDDVAVAELELSRDGVVSHRSGLEGLHLLKLAGSAFSGFWRDEYTTLPDMADRPLYVHLDVYWRYGDFTRRVPSEEVRDTLAATFDGFVSESIQHLVHEMGVRALERFTDIAEISFAGENRLWDTAEISEDERVRVLTDARPPFGVIGLTLAR